ncbi:MAG: hypothetical protein AAF750_10350 [Planctomycetota bacterium]
MSETVLKGRPTVSGVVTDSGLEAMELKVDGGGHYRLKLVWAGGSEVPALGERVTGVIRAKAKRMDVIAAGGRYVEPVHGRPRRVQGRITGGDAGANVVDVSAGPAVVVTPTAPGQQAADFMVGQMVSFDVLRGATFTPVEA